MWGFELTLSDGRKVPGVIFPDGGVYAHEPIADSYGHLSDLLDNRPDVQNFEVLGPIVPTDRARAQLEADYKRAYKQLNDMLAELERNYEEHKKMLAEYDEYQRETKMLSQEQVQ